MSDTNTPRKPRRTAIVAAAVLTGTIASGALMWQATQAAFVAQTENGVNNWEAGSASLTDNDAGVAMFNVTGMEPGMSGDKCIAVTYKGNATPAIKLYTAPTTFTQSGGTGGNLGDYLKVSVDESAQQPGTTPQTYGDCTGFASANTAFTLGTLANFATKTDHAGGYGTWAVNSPDPTNGVMKVYKFHYEFDPAAPNTLQGAKASITFKWEAK